MGPPALLLLLLLLLLPPGPPAAPAAPRARPSPGRLGCLLQDGLCGAQETCVNDGVFGRCQKIPSLDMEHYELYPGALQQLAATLHELSNTGLGRQEEPSELLLHPQNQPRRPLTPNPAQGLRRQVDAGRRPDLESKSALTTALQNYLPYLKALSQAMAPDTPSWMPHDGPSAQESDQHAEWSLSFKAPAPALTFTPEGAPPHTLDWLQPDQLSPRTDGEPDSQSLLDALSAYMQHNPSDGLPDSDPRVLHWGGGKKLTTPQKSPVTPSGPWAQLDTGLGLEPQDAGGGDRAEQEAAHENTLQEESYPHLQPGAHPADPVETERSGVVGMDLSSEEEEEEQQVGLEDVRSYTYSRTLRPTGTQVKPSAPQGPGGLGLQLEVKPPVEEPGVIMTDHDPLSLEQGSSLLRALGRLLGLPEETFSSIHVQGPAVIFRVSNSHSLNLTAAALAQAAVNNSAQLEVSTGLHVLQMGPGPEGPRPAADDPTTFVVLTLLSLAAMAGVLLASGVLYCLRHGARTTPEKPPQTPLGTPGPDAAATYQELCRQHAAACSERPEAPRASRGSSVSSQLSDSPWLSTPSRGSASPWTEGPVQPHMDISTGHAVLAYMEDHLKNKNRLEKEWEALCSYQAEPNSTLVAQQEENMAKNRCPAVLAYDHSRVLLKPENSHSSSDYINASPIMDHDPRNPVYVVTQGPLSSTVPDFWQMVWESGCAVIVMLTPLAENGIGQCCQYWPNEGSQLHHVYEVHLVSEHVWCEDFLVRSFYLKNLQAGATRTVTQFHFLSWRDRDVPASTRPLLDFRRKVNRCFRGRSCPVIVHCSDGAGRSGTYVLIDMVLNKMTKGAKELDIAATLEHLRDQRPGMVQTKEQFEFALTAVAEEVNAILKALPQ